MNGKIQGIIVCGVVIICLGGTMFFLNKSGDGDNSNTSSKAETTSSQTTTDSSEENAVLLIDSASNEITKVYVENEYGSYTMVASNSGKGTWNIEELNSINQSKTLEAGLAENLSQFEAYKEVEKDAGDLEKYGLKDPVGKFTVTFKDETQKTFLVGNVSTKTRYTYLCEEGKSTVYMMLNSKVSYFIEPVNTFVDTSLIATEDDPVYGKLVVDRSDLDYDMVFEPDPYNNEGMVSAQVMTAPIFSYLDVTNSAATTHGMWGLSATAATVINPDEDDFKEYGLDKPLATVTLKGEDYDYKLLIGNGIFEKDSDDKDTTNIGSYYCYLTGVDGIDCIWEISASSLPWATISANDVITTLMTTNNIIDVKEININTSDKDRKYILDSDGESTINSVNLDGKDIDVSLFQNLYEYFLGCPGNEIYFEEPTGECYLTIEIICEDGSSDKVEIYEDKSRRSIVVLNGVPSYKIQKNWATQFIKNVENIEKGKDVVTNY